MFLLKFITQDVLQNTSSDLLDSGVEPLSGNRNYDLDYADDIVILTGHAQIIQRALDHLGSEVSRYGM